MGLTKHGVNTQHIRICADIVECQTSTHMSHMQLPTHHICAYNMYIHVRPIRYSVRTWYVKWYVLHNYLIIRMNLIVVEEGHKGRLVQTVCKVWYDAFYNVCVYVLWTDQRAVLVCIRAGGRESGFSQQSISMQYQRRARKKGLALSTRSLGRASTGSTCQREGKGKGQEEGHSKM